jgi:N-acetylglucosamine-6-phosphate deacetylase
MLPRHPNFIWAQLADDRLTACLIADGHHLPADTLTAMMRAKGSERVVLVSDSTALGGLPPGIYHQTIGGEVELSADGRLSMRGTPYLAGAALPLPDMVARAVDLAGISLGEAIRMASRNPGAMVGGRGQLVVGAPADIIRFHWKPGARTLTMDQVIAGGCAH